MDLQQMIKEYGYDSQKLIDYGFTFDNDRYTYKTSLNDDFYVIIHISSQIDIHVYDTFLDEEYLPFTIKNSKGQLVTTLKKQVNDIVEDIFQQCFNHTNMKDHIINYVKDTYNTSLDYPFSDDNHSFVFRTPQNKWYAICMCIPYEKLNPLKTGKVTIINVKQSPQRIKELICLNHFYPAYHMNKKYWITIVLDKSLNIDLLHQCIDESYQLVSNKKR